MSARNRLQRQRNAKTQLRRILEHPRMVLVVHYSCESFYDRPEGASPRTTSIAVRYFDSGQTTSFSIHQVAEELGVPLEELSSRYAEVEREMLRRFFDFVRKHQHSYWLHWNMRDISYGFAALEHRARVLGVDPQHVSDDYKVDLSRVLIDIYGTGYVGHPRLEKILALNKIGMKDFLVGKDEAEAFEAGHYVKLHMSTLRKVDVIAALAERTEAGQLKTQATWWEKHGNSIVGVAEAATDNWIVKALGLLALIFAIVGGIAWLIGLY